MNSWINFKALWEIVVVGLIAGAGLPALFAVGMVAMSQPGRVRTRTPVPAGAGSSDTEPGGDAEGAESDSLVGGSVPGLIAGAICFLIVLAAIGWGIYAIYQSGHPHK
jgi:hypothetical protein